ncbi:MULTISPECIES: hypothetical protein [unclassified Amycolatopsis]|uniref:hypothetical protein n=1 Tax=unclassified Amycolatopsis TaxID=2618356 RepID=UPI002875C30B|nr:MULTISPECIES: hypothetical protein [unclassified Amycolatopsis]MDS0139616.1 hypothetical protein [Amycolatopsis sp. 505]MDS0145039.1 hypothetical protein [Amycolatopsis sp. CM201R]
MTAAPYPYPYGPPPAQPPADPGAVFRLFAAILGILAAALVITGSFLPQTSFEQVVDGKTESSQTISAWSRSFAVEPGEEAKKFYEQTHVARYGIPLTAASVVLLAGAGLALAGARRSAKPGVRSAARTALVAGAAGVTAAVWMLGMDVSATLSYESDEGTVKSHYLTGIGFWLLIGGGIVALLALVSAALAGRQAPAAAPAGPPPGPYQQPSRPYPVPQQQFAQPYQGYPPSQPFPAQAPPQTGPQPPPSYGTPASPSQQPDDPYGGVTQAQPHPDRQEPTEPNYQLPPLNPPNT